MSKKVGSPSEASLIDISNDILEEMESEEPECQKHYQVLLETGYPKELLRAYWEKFNI